LHGADLVASEVIHVGSERGNGRAIRRRLVASAALMFGAVGTLLLAILAVVDLLRGVLGLALFGLAVVCASQVVVRRGPLRVVGLSAAALLFVSGAALTIGVHPALVLGATAATSLALGAAAYAFRIKVHLPAAPRPSHPVLFWNRRSGGGKVERFHLCEEARARGIEPIELTSGTDIEELVLCALSEGADALAVAGGDGSQAVVASIAAERGLPYACIPAGTRNHFALDLGVDREDIVGALDAFVDGGERRVDVGAVNGRTFLNNVSLGVYGQAVQRPQYRDAKVHTLLETVPDVIGPEVPPQIEWRGPDGEPHQGAAVVIVSNNPYRLGHPIGEGTRPRLDGAVLGIAVIDRNGLKTWSVPSFEIDAQGPVPAGLDGEPVVLAAPLRFHIRPAALRCRIARHHPGASPSSFAPDGLWDGIRALVHIAEGRYPECRERGPEPC
jgi:diacylglycerol kinase family enzyme